MDKHLKNKKLKKKKEHVLAHAFVPFWPRELQLVQLQTCYYCENAFALNYTSHLGFLNAFLEYS